jgi:hypothetical protein
MKGVVSYHRESICYLFPFSYLLCSANVLKRIFGDWLKVIDSSVRLKLNMKKIKVGILPWICGKHNQPSLMMASILIQI